MVFVFRFLISVLFVKRWFESRYLSTQRNIFYTISDYDMSIVRYLYFYHYFLKAIHATFLTNYTMVEEYYKQAKKDISRYT